jgi:hypothetical protein
MKIDAWWMDFLVARGACMNDRRGATPRATAAAPTMLTHRGKCIEAQNPYFRKSPDFAFLALLSGQNQQF